jgi:hypothetical protein
VWASVSEMESGCFHVQARVGVNRTSLQTDSAQIARASELNRHRDDEF